MHDIDLYVVAAGYGSRFRENTPKALVSIINEPCLTRTLRYAAARFRNVFVITNVLAGDVWHGYFDALRCSDPDLYRPLVHLPIRSGLGDGHATLHGLLAAERAERICLARELVIMWGDVFLPSMELFDEISSCSYSGVGLLPAVTERNPYVRILVDDQMRCISADFSKHGEQHATGLHDQSVFRFARRPLRDSLSELHRCLWKNDRYITPGGELSLLYSIHQLYNAGTPVLAYETKHATRSFNTVEEVSRIREEMLSSLDSASSTQEVQLRVRH